MKAFSALLRVSMTALLRSISPGRGGLALAVGVLLVASSVRLFASYRRREPRR